MLFLSFVYYTPIRITADFPKFGTSTKKNNSLWLAENEVKCETDVPHPSPKTRHVCGVISFYLLSTCDKCNFLLALSASCRVFSFNQQF